MRAESCLKTYISDFEYLKGLNCKLEKNLRIVKEDLHEMQDNYEVLEEANKDLRRRLQANETKEKILGQERQLHRSTALRSDSDGKIKLQDESGFCHSRNNSSALRTAGGLLTSNRFSISEVDHEVLRVKFDAGALASSILEKASGPSFQDHDSNGVRSIRIEDIEDLPEEDGRETHAYQFKDFGTSIPINDEQAEKISEIL